MHTHAHTRTHTHTHTHSHSFHTPDVYSATPTDQRQNDYPPIYYSLFTLCAGFSWKMIVYDSYCYLYTKILYETDTHTHSLVKQHTHTHTHTHTEHMFFLTPDGAALH